MTRNRFHEKNEQHSSRNITCSMTGWQSHPRWCWLYLLVAHLQIKSKIPWLSNLSCGLTYLRAVPQTNISSSNNIVTTTSGINTSIRVLPQNVAPLFCIHTSKTSSSAGSGDTGLGWSHACHWNSRQTYITSLVIQSPRFILGFPIRHYNSLPHTVVPLWRQSTGSIQLFSPSGISNLASRIHNPQIHPHSEQLPRNSHTRL